MYINISGRYKNKRHDNVSGHVFSLHAQHIIFPLVNWEQAPLLLIYGMWMKRKWQKFSLKGCLEAPWHYLDYMLLSECQT